MKPTRHLKEVEPSALSRRAMLKAGMCALAGLSSLARCGPGKVNKKTNFVLVILDALRAASLPMYGYGRETAPFLAELAGRATLYRRCYASSTWTTPSVAGLMTGLAPTDHQCTTLNRTLPADMPTLPGLLAKNGYRTGFFTSYGMVGKFKNHFQDASTAAVKDHDGYVLAEEVNQWLERHAGRPVFAYLHYLQPHGPYNPPRRYLEAMQGQPAPSRDFLADHHQDVDIAFSSHGVMGRIPWYTGYVTRYSTDPLRYQEQYDAHIRYVDDLLAHLFSVWTDRRGRERTVFVITADHGEVFGEHGFFCYHGKMLTDRLLHVPLLIFDSEDPKGREFGFPVSHLDVPNTILAAAGLPDRLGYLGRTIHPVDRGQGRKNRIIVSEQLPAGEGIRNEGEYGYALTSGSMRLVYNDCPNFGNVHVLDVISSRDEGAESRRIPLPIPETALKSPLTLSDGVVLHALALHGPHAEAGASYGFSGTLETGKDRIGILRLRLRMHRGPERLLGEWPCTEGWNRIEGEVAFAEDVEGALTGRAVLEADWRPGGPESRSTGWRRLFSFPVHAAKALNENFLLIGAEFEPGAACPGELVRVTYILRCLRRRARAIGVRVLFIDENGETAFRADRAFFEDPAAESQEGKAVKEVPEGFRFDASHVITVPASAAPGRYAVRVGLFEVEGEDRNGDREAPLVGGPVAAGALTVAESTRGAFAVLMEEDRELAAFHMLSRDSFVSSKGPKDHPSRLAVLCERQPGEGHVHYLRALEEGTEEERRALLEQCLAAAPFHLRALELAQEASRSGGIGERLEMLTPPRPCALNFQDLIQLDGFGLVRSPSGDALYLSLYWRALSRLSRIYAAEMELKELRLTRDSRNLRCRNLMWFLGSHIHSAYDWRIGEVVVERIRIPLNGDEEKVALSLEVYPHWDSTYADTEEKSSLILMEGEAGTKSVRAELGPFGIQDLETHDRDLLAAKRENALFYQLYDLAKDPEERFDLARRRPEAFQKLHAGLLKYLETRKEARSSARTESIELSEEEKEKLRALGYL